MCKRTFRMYPFTAACCRVNYWNHNHSQEEVQLAAYRTWPGCAFLPVPSNVRLITDAPKRDPAIQKKNGTCDTPSGSTPHMGPSSSGHWLGECIWIFTVHKVDNSDRAMSRPQLTEPNQLRGAQSICAVERHFVWLPKMGLMDSGDVSLP